MYVICIISHSFRNKYNSLLKIFKKIFQTGQTWELMYLETAWGASWTQSELGRNRCSSGPPQRSSSSSWRSCRPIVIPSTYDRSSYGYIDYIGEFEVVDDHRNKKIVIELLGRVNKCGVISPRFDVCLNVSKFLNLMTTVGLWEMDGKYFTFKAVRIPGAHHKLW